MCLLHFELVKQDRQLFTLILPWRHLFVCDTLHRVWNTKVDKIVSQE